MMLRYALLVCWSLAVCASPAFAATPAREMEALLRRSGQLILVSVADWPENRGTLVLYEQAGTQGWRRVSSAVEVTLGRNGLAWGVGLHGPSATKREGDGRSPAGIFELARIHGRDAEPPSKRFPYRQLSATTEGIDDPQSRFYNRMVDATSVSDRDWKSSEKVRPANPMFRWVVEVKHNWAQRPGLGSCIWLHIWKAPGVATSGCTAMSEGGLERLVRWLDADKKPLLVQMPEAELRRNGLRQMLAE